MRRSHTWAWSLALWGASCAQGGTSGFAGMKPPAHDAALEGSPSPCPDDMVYIEPPASGTRLGEVDPGWTEDLGGQAYQHTILESRLVPRQAYCVAQYPFPGEGEHWATEAAYFELMSALEARLLEGGRRLCSVSELLFAAAGPENWRFSTHPEQRVDGCEPDDHTPGLPIGAYKSCVSPLLVHDFNVRSSWVRVHDWEQEILRAGMVPEGELLEYGVYGGTSRDDTFYPPTNFALHFHPEGLMAGGGYRDDDLRVCGDPGGVSLELDEQWMDLTAAFIEGGSTYREWLR